APDGAEQAHEGGGGTDRGEDGEAGLQLRRAVVDRVAQAARHPVARVHAVLQPRARLALAEVRGGIAALQGEPVERVVLRGAELREAAGEVGRGPEALDGLRLFRTASLIEGLDGDHGPGGQRHACEEQEHAPGDEIALGPDVDEAEWGMHGIYS